MEAKNKSRNIVIVGRPNVGKSTLFNRLVGGELALTHDTPGVTRDCQRAPIKRLREDLDVTAIDSGGFYPDGGKFSFPYYMGCRHTHEKFDWEAFYKTVSGTISSVVKSADLALLVLDFKTGPLPYDKQIVRYLREHGVDFWPVVNKTDVHLDHKSLFYDLGFNEDEIFWASASHNRGLEALRDAFEARWPEEKIEAPAVTELEIEEAAEGAEAAEAVEENATDAAEENSEAEIKLLGKIALLGGPNAGKSTLLNQLAGKNSSLVSALPGTTVDPVSETVVVEDKKGAKHALKFVDTAGIRRRTQVLRGIEAQSVKLSIGTMEKSDVVLYMVDVKVGMTHQDLRLIRLALDRGRSVIILLNKIDIAYKDQKLKFKEEKWLREVKKSVTWLNFCTFISCSAKEGRGITKLITEIFKCFKLRDKKIASRTILSVLEELLEKKVMYVTRGRSGARAGRGKTSKPFKVKYAAYVSHAPPSFLLFTNTKEKLPQTYQKYIENGLRRAFDIKGAPVRLIFRRANPGRDELHQ